MSEDFINCGDLDESTPDEILKSRTKLCDATDFFLLGEALEDNFVPEDWPTLSFLICKQELPILDPWILEFLCCNVPFLVFLNYKSNKQWLFVGKKKKKKDRLLETFIKLNGTYV